MSVYVLYTGRHDSFFGRVTLQDPQEFPAEAGVVLQDPTPIHTKIPSFLPKRNFALHEMGGYNLWVDGDVSCCLIGGSVIVGDRQDDGEHLGFALYGERVADENPGTGLCITKVP